MITKNVSESKPNRTGKNTYRQVCCYIATCWWSDRHSCRRVIHVLERELEIECRLWKGINIVLISINDKNSMLATTKSTLVNIHEAAWILLLFESQVARERGHWTFAVNLVVWDIKHTLRRAWTLQKWGVPFPSCLAIQPGIDDPGYLGPGRPGSPNSLSIPRAGICSHPGGPRPAH